MARLGFFHFECVKINFYRHGFYHDDDNLFRENSTIDTFTLKKKKEKKKMKEERPKGRKNNERLTRIDHAIFIANLYATPTISLTC